MMSYPLQLTFKILAVAPQVTVTDAAGNLRYYVKQKAFKLKESVGVFADREQTRPVARIEADRIIDIAASYQIRDDQGQELGVVRRRGMRSFWRSHYEIETADGRPFGEIREGNPWVKLVDGLIGEIPIVGLLSGYVLHPTYLFTREDGAEVLRVAKQPALFEGRYTIERIGGLEEEDEELAILSVLMMVLLERTRG